MGHTRLSVALFCSMPRCGVSWSISLRPAPPVASGPSGQADLRRHRDKVAHLSGAPFVMSALTPPRRRRLFAQASPQPSAADAGRVIPRWTNRLRATHLYGDETYGRPAKRMARRMTSFPPKTASPSASARRAYHASRFAVMEPAPGEKCTATARTWASQFRAIS